MNNIYIEISPRGSGKTYRLVKDIINYLNSHPSSDVYVVSPTLRGSDFILNHKEIKLCNLSNRIKIAVASDSLHGLNGKRVYYDEFLYIDCRLSVNPNGYYCSTARAHKFDKSYSSTFLAELLKANDYKYVSYTIPADFEYIYDLVATYGSNEAVNTEYFNHLFV